MTKTSRIAVVFVTFCILCCMACGTCCGGEEFGPDISIRMDVDDANEYARVWFDGCTFEHCVLGTVHKTARYFEKFRPDDSCTKIVNVPIDYAVSQYEEGKTAKLYFTVERISWFLTTVSRVDHIVFDITKEVEDALTKDEKITVKINTSKSVWGFDELTIKINGKTVRVLKAANRDTAGEYTEPGYEGLHN